MKQAQELQNKLTTLMNEYNIRGGAVIVWPNGAVQEFNFDTPAFVMLGVLDCWRDNVKEQIRQVRAEQRAMLRSDVN